MIAELLRRFFPKESPEPEPADDDFGHYVAATTFDTAVTPFERVATFRAGRFVGRRYLTSTLSVDAGGFLRVESVKPFDTVFLESSFGCSRRIETPEGLIKIV